jgi:hypothetical protein
MTMFLLDMQLLFFARHDAPLLSRRKQPHRTTIPLVFITRLPTELELLAVNLTKKFQR